MTGNYPSYFDELEQIHEHLVELRLEYWLSHNLFTFQWWLLVIVFIVPWFIWWKYVDKKRISSILLFGTLLMLLVIMLDVLGVEGGLWSYPYQLLYLLPRLIPIDQGIIIVAHMFLYQYFPKWKGFIIANTIMALLFSFFFEPLTVWLGIYRIENWRYIYSLPIYIAKAAFIKWLVDHVILNVEFMHKHQQE